MKKCEFCGTELKDEVKFCVQCGRPVEKDLLAASPEKVKKPDDKKSKRGIIASAVVLTLLIVGAIAVFLLKSIKPEPASQDFAMGEESQVVRESKEKTLVSETTMVAEMGTDIGSDTEESSINILIAVPQESLPVRSLPQLEAEALCEIPVGTLMEQIGDVIKTNDREFYLVKVLDSTGQEGYVAAGSCAPLEYKSDDSLLTTVSVQSALYTYDQMVTDIHTLAQRYGSALTARILGQSGQGRDIYEVILGDKNAPHHILIQAGIHGREYMSTQLVMKMAEYYAVNMSMANYKGQSYETLFQNTAFHIVPMSNPDGVCISQYGESSISSVEGRQLLRDCYDRDKETLIYKMDSNGDLDWSDVYKEADFDRAAQGYEEIISYEEYLKRWKANANGVDINRNFNALWAQMDLKPFPASDKYKGAVPESEPETQILIDLARKYKYDALINYHARGQLIYFNTKENPTDMKNQSEILARLASSLNKYQLVDTGVAEEVDSGGYGDWMMREVMVPSITIEVGKHPCPVQIEEFPTVWLRNRELWAKLAYGM